MKKFLVVMAALACSCGLCTIQANTASGAAKNDLSGQQPAEKTSSPANPSKPRTAEEDKSKTSSKIAPLGDSKKKAQDLLNRCYQEALTSDPGVKVPTLLEIAQSMNRINSERALLIYDQAFNATSELQDSKMAANRRSYQALIARAVSYIDLEKGLEVALRIERSPTARGRDDPRTNTLSLIVIQLAAKNPDRAFEIAREEISHGDCGVSFVVGMAQALRKAYPDKAEILYLEAIRQFDKPVSDASEVQNFVTLTLRLFDLNRGLTEQALDLILKAIDYLGDHPPERDVLLEFFDGQTKTSFNGVREYAIVETVAMMRRLDPERAKGLEGKFSDIREKLAKSPGGFLMPWEAAVEAQRPKPSDQTSGSDPTRSALVKPPESYPYMRTSVATRDSSGVLRSPSYLSRSIDDMQARRQMEQAIGLAGTDSGAALAQMEKVAPGPDRIEVMARVAVAIFKTDPEKAKGLLRDAASATEKITDAYDRAKCDAFLVEGFLLFDVGRARELMADALKLGDQAEEEAYQKRSSPTTPGLTYDPRRDLGLLSTRLLSSLTKLNIDEAIARANEMKDTRRRLHALVSIANLILSQK